MEVQHITDEFSVSDQLTAKDVSLASAEGFRTLICIRPDGEDIAQALFEQIMEASKVSKLTAIYLPISSSIPSGKDIADFANAFAAAEKPVLAYAATHEPSKVLFEAAMWQRNKT